MKRRLVCGVAAFVVSLSFCLLASLGVAGSNTASPTVWANYDDALFATAAPTIDMVPAASQWTSLDPADPSQTWRVGSDGKQQVLVSFVTDYTGYDSLVGNYTTRSSGETWVSVVPTTSNYIAANGTGGESLPTRLDEYLGLTPDYSPSRVVNLWVSLDDIVRPSVNPDPTSDREQGYGLRDFASALAAKGNTGYDIGSSTYAAWFGNRKQTIYFPTDGSEGYPWTGFGYTYNYSSDSTDNVGAAEFIVKPGSNVEIVSSTPVADAFK